METVDVLIAGSGHAAAQAAIALRQNGHEGSILMVGRESEPPYERPPLSKEYLSGEKPRERLYIRPEAFWADKQVQLRLGQPILSVDPAARSVTLGDETQIGYGSLIWATGGDARRLACEGGSLEGIHTVRNRGDADAMRAALDAGARRAVVIGGGYIGLEAAAVLRKFGLEVTLIETLDRLLARVAGPELSQFYLDEHRSHGVDIRLETSVEAFTGEGGRVNGVMLGDGSKLPADLVVVGIGIIPAVGPLLAAGAAGGNGVDVDEFCRTSLEHVYAVGDCAAHANHFADGAVIRVESVQNANDMATTAAKAICGHGEPYHAFPWFWSNQYDLRLQTAGLALGADERVLRGDPAERKFSLVYLKHGRVIALDCVNNTKDYVQGRKLIEARIAPDRTALADPEIPLKELL